MVSPRIGGSFAPPLTDETLAEYRTLIDVLDPQSLERDAMEQLYKCASAWWEQPESTGTGRAHPVGRGLIVDLDAPIATALRDSIPWRHELDAWATLFDGLSGPVRDAAFHLLWFGNELDLNREPITADKVA